MLCGTQCPSGNSNIEIGGAGVGRKKEGHYAECSALIYSMTKFEGEGGMEGDRGASLLY